MYTDNLPSAPPLNHSLRENLEHIRTLLVLVENFATASVYAATPGSEEDKTFSGLSSLLEIINRTLLREINALDNQPRTH